MSPPSFARSARRPDASPPPRVAVFCRVVDNYGDAGVCWRLARQLAAEHAARVTLWIDRPSTLSAIAPAHGTTAGVTVRQWDDAADVAGDDRIVVSAFGCELPAAVRRRVTGAHAPLWVNLEYLSAEDWVEGCHGLASTRPQDGAVEHFFYPGFTPATGGLLREARLLAERDAFVAGDGPARWLADRGLARQPGERIASLFCYPDAPVADWLALLAGGATRWRVLVPAGIADAGIAAFLGAPLAVGAAAQRGRLTLQRFALMPQPDYDRLLWSCDLNLVRGEDSWIRAHWAARPFVWQPYPQVGGAHLGKLEAFLRRFAAGGGPADAAGAAAMMRAWSGDGRLPAAWAAFAGALVSGDGLAAVYRRWCDRLAGQRDLCTALLEFCENRL